MSSVRALRVMRALERAYVYHSQAIVAFGPELAAWIKIPDDSQEFGLKASSCLNSSAHE